MVGAGFEADPDVGGRMFTMMTMADMAHASALSNEIKRRLKPSPATRGGRRRDSGSRDRSA